MKLVARVAMTPNHTPFAPVDPMREGHTNPVGVADLPPDRSWTFPDSDRHEFDSA